MIWACGYHFPEKSGSNPASNIDFIIEYVYMYKICKTNSNNKCESKWNFVSS